MKTYLSGWIMTGGIKTDTQYIGLKIHKLASSFIYKAKKNVVYFLCGQSSLGRVHPLSSLVFKGGRVALLPLKFP